MKLLLSLSVVILFVAATQPLDCGCVPENSVKCDNVTGVCQCRDGWTGQDCSQDVDECLQTSNPCGNASNATCNNTPGAYTCECENGTWWGATGECLESLPFQCEKSADIVFVMDSSGSIGTNNFQRQLTFAANVAAFMRLSSKEIRFGLVEFDLDAVKVFDLNAYDSDADLRQAIMNVTYLGQGTRTDKALQLLTSEQMFSEAAGGRDDAPDIIITITDGRSNEPKLTKEAALKLKASDVTMFAVGIADSVDLSELETLSTRPELVLLADNFTTLDEILSPLLNKTCTVIQELQVNYQYVPNVCKGGDFTNGVAVLPYPGDCTKLIQCYYSELSKKTLVVIRRCPLGEFWNQNTSECAPSWKVQCPFDQCQGGCEQGSPWDNSLTEVDGVMTYPMEANKRGYFACDKGRSLPKCCPKNVGYVPGVGCSLSLNADLECGPESSCGDGVGVCKKVPAWDNRNSFLELTQTLGYYPVSCIYADFNIVDCRCNVKTLNDQYHDKSSCTPYFQTNISEDCAEEVYQVPALGRTFEKSAVTIKFSLSLSSPHFQVVSTPESQCQGCVGLKVWGDMDTINVALGNKQNKSQAAVLWRNATGDLDITVVIHEGMITFGVTQGRYEVVTSVEALVTSDTLKCSYRVKTKSDFKNTCILSQLQILNCNYSFDNIYNVSS
ncbi:uncharacterized protein LOC106070079 [Biomphalaria glabrata]|uniref:Uncharacterized protein LOC106070079 n=1 Tax=Biomphalaria glabrata TaxID=6526 RepID=A0A9W3BLY5_BIOGL|nr:uncharacterized protein LOC106070079 [Biomphalaria glabrata]